MSKIQDFIVISLVSCFGIVLIPLVFIVKFIAGIIVIVLGLLAVIYLALEKLIKGGKNGKV